MKVLWVTYCSKDKNNIARGPPDRLYRSPRISEFVEFCKGKSLQWAILSAKYDLFFPSEEHEPYDVTFKTDLQSGECIVVQNKLPLSVNESRKWMDDLAKRIADKIKRCGIQEIIFFAGKTGESESPEDRFKRVKCYLKVLHAGADGCTINHLRWYEIVDCIKKYCTSGKGIKLTTELRL